MMNWLAVRGICLLVIGCFAANGFAQTSVSTDEIRFREWKFGDDVDLEPLEEESFTPEKIRASIDFKAVRDLFDKSK